MAKLAALNQEDLKSQAFAKAEENKIQKLSLENNSYHMKDKFNVSSVYLFFLSQ